jgi:hypothetical protein
MRRCEFIRLLGGVATAWPLAAHAQRPEMRRSGLALTEDDPEELADAAALVQGGLRSSLWRCGPHLRSKL